MTIQTNNLKNSNYMEYIEQLITEQQEFYQTGITRDFIFRKNQLKKLKSIVIKNERLIHQAIDKDLKRNEFGSTFVVGTVIEEINYMLEHIFQLRPPFVTTRLKSWMKAKKVRSPLVLLGSKSYVKARPKGVVLILAPWNFPFILIMLPLIGAIAAGNCVVVKPSEFAPHTSNMIIDLINTNFQRNYIHAEEGDKDVAIQLTNNPKWNHIFFTGGNNIGREVAISAAKNLIPVTLELGGKSPVIVDKSVNINLAAKRIAQMKFFNASQICIAPDYLIVHQEIKEKFIDKLKSTIERFYLDAKESDDYGRIINLTSFDRLSPLLANNEGRILHGGTIDRDEKYIQPTLIDNIDMNSQIMQEEIFGPILPILYYKDKEEVVSLIRSKPHPLSLYIYGQDKKFNNYIFNNLEFGGAMTNETVMHFLHPLIPFGGVGYSGYGNYGGKYSFITFSQERGIVETGGIIDKTIEKLGLKFFRYPPYYPLKVRFLKLFHRTLGRIRI
ncbi:MAG: aldehyde dehydrogenase family protein [Candidatus Heimdallarchaeota archaeon]|nr:aldehyde dehydrogenase family protein [Candidatus Heimdallarchaeota archaeon]MDH5646429.1 aldehyde dehydrogenase family protein [Candidatus Heimdallarchaeota archaeon]